MVAAVGGEEAWDMLEMELMSELGWEVEEEESYSENSEETDYSEDEENVNVEKEEVKVVGKE